MIKAKKVKFSKPDVRVGDKMRSYTYFNQNGKVIYQYVAWVTAKNINQYQRELNVG